MWGAIGSIGGGLLSGAGSLFGGGSDDGGSYAEGVANDLNIDQLHFQRDAIAQYKDMYSQYYWPIEEFLAGNYYSDIQAARPYEETMRDYQLNRGDELIGLAEDTNPLLDDNKKDVIRRLTEGEDVLRDRYRSTASADVSNAFSNQRAQDMRNMQQLGINPSSGTYSSYMSSMGADEALSQAASRTQAAWQAEDTSLQRQMEANNWYTTPSMQYNAGTIQPGMGVSELTGGAYEEAPSYNVSNSTSNSNMWSGLGSAFGGITSGLGQLFA